MVSDKGGADVSKNDGRQKAPDRPESYAVSLSSNKRVAFVDGSDPTGAMYGEFELAEQISGQSGSDWAAAIKPVSKSPYLEVRGVNMFLTVQDVDNPDGAFWSDDYWKTYLDIMARSRYNFLDIHGLCDAVTLTFPKWLFLFSQFARLSRGWRGPRAGGQESRSFSAGDPDGRRSRHQSRLHELRGSAAHRSLENPPCRSGRTLGGRAAAVSGRSAARAIHARSGAQFSEAASRVCGCSVSAWASPGSPRIFTRKPTSRRWRNFRQRRKSICAPGLPIRKKCGSLPPPPRTTSTSSLSTTGNS